MKRAARHSPCSGRIEEENVNNQHCVQETTEDCFSGQIKKQRRIIIYTPPHHIEEEEGEENKNAFDVLPNELLSLILVHLATSLACGLSKCLPAVAPYPFE